MHCCVATIAPVNVVNLKSITEIGDRSTGWTRVVPTMPWYKSTMNAITAEILIHRRLLLRVQHQHQLRAETSVTHAAQTHAVNSGVAGFLILVTASNATTIASARKVGAVRPENASELQF